MNTFLEQYCDGRCYQKRLPEAYVLPAVVFTRITHSVPVDYDGEPIVNITRYQVDVYSHDPEEVDTIATQIFNAANGFRGDFFGTNVTYLESEEIRDLYDHDLNLDRATQDLLIRHI